MNTIPITVRLGDDIVKKVKKLADNENRSVNDYIRSVVINHTKQQTQTIDEKER